LLLASQYFLEEMLASRADHRGMLYWEFILEAVGMAWIDSFLSFFARNQTKKHFQIKLIQIICNEKHGIIL